jgi:hypothetical protein
MRQEKVTGKTKESLGFKTGEKKRQNGLCVGYIWFEGLIQVENNKK